jgi:hypothetical protein
VTSQGHPYARFRRALATGNACLAEAAARDVQHVALRDALELCLLYRDDPERYERAAARWIARLVAERPGVRWRRLSWSRPRSAKPSTTIGGRSCCGIVWQPRHGPPPPYELSLRDGSARVHRNGTHPTRGSEAPAHAHAAPSVRFISHHEQQVKRVAPRGCVTRNRVGAGCPQGGVARRWRAPSSHRRAIAEWGRAGRSVIGTSRRRPTLRGRAYATLVRRLCAPWVGRVRVGRPAGCRGSRRALMLGRAAALGPADSACVHQEPTPLAGRMLVCVCGRPAGGGLQSRSAGL